VLAEGLSVVPPPKFGAFIQRHHDLPFTNIVKIGLKGPLSPDRFNGQRNKTCMFTNLEYSEGPIFKTQSTKLNLMGRQCQDVIVNELRLISSF
jgi:hypothetical protein